MVNADLVLKLMELYAAHTENFPRVLSAIIRREMLGLIDAATEAHNLIKDENNPTSRGRYLGEHLEDLSNAILGVEEFLRYFRDVPLVITKEGEITTGEEVRLKLGDYAKWTMAVREKVRRENWRDIDEAEFDEIKEQARIAAHDAIVELEDLDASLALGWIELDSEPERNEPDFQLE